MERKQKRNAKSRLLNNSYSKQLQDTRYKLNQFYQSKYNDKQKNLMEMKYPLDKHNNTYLAKDSFILEKLSNRNNTNNLNEDVVINVQNYNFERDLFDGEYHQRLEEFNERRKMFMNKVNSNNNKYSHVDNRCSNINTNTKDSMKLSYNYNSNCDSDLYRTYRSYYRSNLSTEIPKRSVQRRDYDDVRFGNVNESRDGASLRKSYM